MLINCETPPDLVVNFAAISIDIKLSVFLELGSTTEAIDTHCKVSVPGRYTAVVIFSKSDAPLLKHVEPIFPVGSAVSFSFGGWLPVTGQEMLKSGVCAGPGLFDEKV